MTTKRSPKLPKHVADALGELKAALTDLYGERLRGLWLFGSYARGDYREDSDVDILLLLAGPDQISEEMNRYGKVRSEICLRHDLVIGIVATSEDRFDRQIEPLFQNVRREGVPV